MSNVFFFQAEDGIRDIGVTGVQTCALPIFLAREPERARGGEEVARMTTLWLVRHGVTSHTGHKLSGWMPDVHLTEEGRAQAEAAADLLADRKSTRLNSSNTNISYAAFCLKKNRIFATQSLAFIP